MAGRSDVTYVCFWSEYHNRLKEGNQENVFLELLTHRSEKINLLGLEIIDLVST
jgi:hypothetical protein